MSEKPERKVERGDAEERFGAPVGEAEEATSRRPASATPDEGDEIDEHELRRLTELNPDDFE